MNNNECDKMLIAILQNDDYHDVIEDLNNNGFYVTVLNSSGGFLKKTSATIMIGLNHEELDGAIEILKKYGKRTQMNYNTVLPSSGAIHSIPIIPTPVPTKCGGVVLFVLDVEQFEKY